MNVKNKFKDKIQVKKCISKNVYGEKQYSNEVEKITSRIEEEVVKRWTKNGEIEEIRTIVYVDKNVEINVGDLLIIEEEGKIPVCVEVNRIIYDKDIKGNVILKKILF